ncbi:MAG: PAS domain S-box protein [Candidatus Delongbacteria bacterium]
MHERDKNNDNFKILFEQAPLGYQSLDIDGNFLEVNQKWLDTFGYERNEVIGKWFGDFLTPEYKEAFKNNFQIFKERGHIHSEFEMVRKNGDILFIAFEGQIGNDAEGHFKQTHCILEDITEKKLAEFDLKKKIAELEDMNTLMLGRELRMIELKKEVNKLLKELGKDEKYEC